MSSFIESKMFVIAVPIITTVGLGLAWPIQAGVTRMMANYAPLAESGDKVDKGTGSLLHTLQRVKRIEGWSGLFKGLYTVIAFTSLSVVTMLPWSGTLSAPLPHETMIAIRRVAVVAAAYSIFTVPMNIIANRAITTSHHMPNNPRKALPMLLSKRELSRPLKLYSRPFLCLFNFIDNLPVSFIAKALGLSIAIDPIHWRNMSWDRWATFVAWQAAGVGIMTPLTVIATRLSIQKNLGDGAEAADALTEVSEKMEVEGQYGKQGVEPEVVVRVRTGKEAYLGMVDCARETIKEEGVGSLFRGWWWILALNFVGGLDIQME